MGIHLASTIKSVLVAASVLISSLPARAAGPALDWVRLIHGNPCGAHCHAAASDSQGNIYLGSGSGTGLTKFDSAGNLLWTWARPENDCAAHVIVHGISVDPSDDIYFSGMTYSSVNIGAFQSPPNSSSLFFAKMGPDRSLAFAKFGSEIRDKVPLVKFTSGTFVVGGTIQDNPFRYEGLTVSPTANADVAILRVNSDGSPVWARRGSGSGYDYLEGIAGSASGEIFVATYTLGAASFGIGGLVVNSSASKTSYLTKLDSAGTGMWIKSVASSFSPTVNEPHSSAVAASLQDGSVLWASDFTDSLSLTYPAIPSSGAKDVFVTKITSAGTNSWVRTLGGTNDEFATAVTVDSRGNTYVAGGFSGQATIGPTTFTSRGREDAFVAKILDDGSVAWVKQIGYSGADRVNGLFLTRNNELLVAGWVEGGFSMDGTFVETTGSAEAFIAKFKNDELPPAFIIHPESRLASGGMTITLFAEASSASQPVSYQWWFNGAELAGQTNSSLTLTNLQSSQGGSYFVVARNAAGPTESRVAILTYSDASSLILSIHPSLQIFGTLGKTYRIDFSTETRTPAQWTPLTNVTLETTPQVWIDQEAAIGAQRYYRVVLQSAQ